MSEAPEAAEIAPDEAAFEAARVEQEGGDDAPDEGAEGEAAEEGEGERSVDWQKRAMDKEGLAAKERARRREAERQVRELNARLERLEARDKPATQAEEDDLLAAINSLRDDDDDPITDLGQIKRALRTFVQQQAKEAESEAQARAQQANIQRLVQTVAEYEADFTDDHPDYADAVKYLGEAIRSDLEDEGYAGAALEREFQQRRIDMAMRFVQNGRDPAEGAYNLAKKRGFKAGEAQAKEKLKEIAAAAAAGKSPAGTAKGDVRLTYDSVSKLKGAAFDAAFAKLREQERRAG